MKNELIAKKGRIRARINVPGVSLDINATDSASTLRELRKILDALNSPKKEEESLSLDFDPGYGWAFSEELRSSPAAMEFIRQATRAEQGTIYRKVCLDNKRVVDTFKKENFSILDAKKTREMLQANLNDLKSHQVRFGLVHVMSTVSKDDKALLIDLLRKRFSNAELKTHFTHKDILGKTVVELVLFGALPREEF